MKDLGVSDIKLMPGQQKQVIAKFDYKGKQRKVKFGDPEMREYPGTKRGDNYCSRSYGLGKKYGVIGDPLSANTWSRIVLWDCVKSKSRR